MLFVGHGLVAKIFLPICFIAEVIVKNSIGPVWSDDQIKAGERMRDSWTEFAAERQSAANPQPQDVLSRVKSAAVGRVQAEHEAELMRYPNVIAVASGIRMTKGKPTGEHCLVVYVSRKIPPDALGEGETLPSSIDGVPVDVVDAGQVEAL